MVILRAKWDKPHKQKAEHVIKYSVCYSCYLKFVCAPCFTFCTFASKIYIFVLWRLHCFFILCPYFWNWYLIFNQNFKIICPPRLIFHVEWRPFSVLEYLNISTSVIIKLCLVLGDIFIFKNVKNLFKYKLCMPNILQTHLPHF